MSARDDYPNLAQMDRELFDFVTFDQELRAALDELDVLRALLDDVGIPRPMKQAATVNHLSNSRVME